MKKSITILALVSMSKLNAQMLVADFESFTLTTNSFYKDTNSVPFQTANAIFPYEWTKGQFAYWSGGTAYTNVNDSVTGDFTNLYGVKALKGFTNSANYAVMQDRATIRVKSPYAIVEGFYFTNTTYAFTSMKEGDFFARKFGDTTGTGSGTTIAQGAYPDFFKVTVKGYKNGIQKVDTVQFMLADFTFTNSAQDYIVKDWRWVNVSQIGEVDSLKFIMYSSDVGNFGINTPLYFGIDNFTSKLPSYVGLNDLNLSADIVAFPNPFISEINIKGSNKQTITQVKLVDIHGKCLHIDSDSNASSVELNLGHLDAGIYFLEVYCNEQKTLKKLIKN